jgi:hypothetical protein
MQIVFLDELPEVHDQILEYVGGEAANRLKKYAASLLNTGGVTLEAL